MPSTSADTLPSFERVYREQFEFVWRTVRALGVCDAAADDAVQDVFVVVHRRLGEFEGRASVRTWTYEIARRVALRHRTVAARHAARHSELLELPARDDLDGAIDEAKATEVMREFLWALDEDRRRAFVLSEFGEMPGREIAELLGVNMNTIYARIRSARTELDRLAKRLHAHDTGAVRRVLRGRRPSRSAKQRAWAGVLGAISAPAGGVGVGAAGLAWLVGGLATAAVSIAVISRSPKPEVRPEAFLLEQVAAARIEPRPAPLAAPLPTPEVSTSTPPPQPIAQPARTAKPVAPSLTEELQRVREIRDAVRAGATSDATAAISAYRMAHVHGTLGTEVDALEVELACRTRAPDATRRLEAFRATRPDAPLLSRLQVVCTETIAPRKPAAGRTEAP